MLTTTAADKISSRILNRNPILAILTTISSSGKIKGNLKNFIDIIKTGYNMGFTVYVLPIERVQLHKNRVKGFTYDIDSRQWQEQEMPLPSIIYNRIPYREDEKLSYVKAKLALINKEPSIIMFNPYFFNKWQLFRWLRQSSYTKSFLPQTKRLTHIKDLDEAIERFQFLYLKPESGKAGSGIMSVVKEDAAPLPYTLNIQNKKQGKTVKCKTIDQLWKKVRQECATAPYILQQGIKLVRYKGRKFDLRLLVQKNIRGQWELTGIGARIAGGTSITTHVPRGGKIDEPQKLLIENFGSIKAKSILERAENAALLIAEQIERAGKNVLGEMSMDIGVDDKGEIWFFEANSKPMKFDEPHIRQKSLQRIFQYGQYLLQKN